MIAALRGGVVIVMVLLVPVMLFLVLFAMAALEDRMFPLPQPPGPEPEIPEQSVAD
ncbi:hypothetical protein [Streptomyces sp. UG1]|uniref:hypothetical protein n=1 Tax=Streptomyces sp. UG1 TaxID=3417652 RepID=UPI003CEB0DF8